MVMCRAVRRCSAEVCTAEVNCGGEPVKGNQIPMRIVSSLLALTGEAVPYDVLMDVRAADLAMVMGPGRSGAAAAVEAMRMMMGEAVMGLLQEQIDGLRRKSSAVAEMEVECFPADEDEHKRVWSLREPSWEVAALARGMGTGGRSTPLRDDAPDLFWGRLLMDIFRLGVKVGRSDSKVAAAIFVLLADTEQQLDQSMQSLKAMFPSAAATTSTQQEEEDAFVQALTTILRRETLAMKDRVRKHEEGEEEDEDEDVEVEDVFESRPFHIPTPTKNPALDYMDDIDVDDDSEEATPAPAPQQPSRIEEEEVSEIRAFL